MAEEASLSHAPSPLTNPLVVRLIFDLMLWGFFLIHLTIYFNSPLEHTLRFEISKKVPIISLYWFAVHQQTSTCRRQKNCSSYIKFSVECTEFTPSFRKQQEVA